MTDHSQFAQLLTTWYAEGVRGFLSEVAGDRLEQLEQEFARLGKLGDLLKRQMPICFLGTAGVGKSTLINALVAGRDVILPAGGVGPLTAEATRVCYASERRFGVDYHPPAKLNKLLFILERAHEKELERQGRNDTFRGASEADEIAANDFDDSWAVNAEAADLGEPFDLVGALTRQAAHLVRGDQYAVLDRAYLLDRLRD